MQIQSNRKRMFIKINFVLFFGQLCQSAFLLGLNLGRRDAIFNRISPMRSPRQRKVT